MFHLLRRLFHHCRHCCGVLAVGVALTVGGQSLQACDGFFLSNGAFVSGSTCGNVSTVVTNVVPAYAFNTLSYVPGFNTFVDVGPRFIHVNNGGNVNVRVRGANVNVASGANVNVRTGFFGRTHVRIN